MDALQASLLRGSIALLQLRSWEGVLYLCVTACRADIGRFRPSEVPLPLFPDFISTAVTADSRAVRARQFPLCICEAADIQPLVARSALRRGCTTFLKSFPIDALSMKLSQKKCCALGPTFAIGTA